jgi:hypothetical protein
VPVIVARALVAVAVAVAVWAALAQPAAAAPAPIKIAIVPVRESADAAAVERALVDAVKETPSLALLNVGPNGRLLPPKQAPIEARANPSPAALAPALGREVGAARALAVDVARLGEGRVLYLQAIESSSGRALASTTVAVAGESGDITAGDRARLRAGLVSVLDPERYVGRLQLKVDVAGAEVLVDGRRVTTLVGQPVDVAVGTHALRVTHPAYRDFLRFVDVEFDKTTALEVALSAYPLTEGEMAQKAKDAEAQRRKQKPLPWYKRWWLLPVAGAAIAAVAAGVTWGVRAGVSADQTVTYTAPPQP